MVKTRTCLWYFCGQSRNRRGKNHGDFHFGGPNRDRTDDLTDAKRHIKLFCMISNYLWCFPLGFSLFPPLFSTLVTMCCTAVCGASCGQKRSLPFAGNGFPTWTGSIFRASDCLHCNSESEIRQVLSALSVPQKLGGCKQRGEERFFTLFSFILCAFRSIPFAFHHSLKLLFPHVPHRTVAKMWSKTLPVLCRRRFPG